mmetsp:Transcript_37020/g.78708  ORF Transcript_37020/g.78708 Transcript_37020/m.78708 type:complete len:226 (+) Transcript_37020:1-678(+)
MLAVSRAMLAAKLVKRSSMRLSKISFFFVRVVSDKRSLAFAKPFNLKHPSMNSWQVSSPFSSTSRSSKSSEVSSILRPLACSFAKPPGVCRPAKNSDLLISWLALPSKCVKTFRSFRICSRISFRAFENSSSSVLIAVVMACSTIMATTRFRRTKLVNAMKSTKKMAIAGYRANMGRATALAQESPVVTWKRVNIDRKTEPQCSSMSSSVLVMSAAIRVTKMALM